MSVEIAFIGADRGFDRGMEHAFGRSLKRELALERGCAAGVGHERRSRCCRSTAIRCA